MSSKQKLKRRKKRTVLRFDVANANKNAEGYEHQRLFSFYPFRDNLSINFLAQKNPIFFIYKKFKTRTF